MPKLENVENAFLPSSAFEVQGYSDPFPQQPVDGTHPTISCDSLVDWSAHPVGLRTVRLCLVAT